jgi:hypothetical protein
LSRLFRVRRGCSAGGWVRACCRWLASGSLIGSRAWFRPGGVGVAPLFAPFKCRLLAGPRLVSHVRIAKCMTINSHKFTGEIRLYFRRIHPPNTTGHTFDKLQTK